MRGPGVAMRAVVFALVLAACLAGCATKYQDIGLSGGVSAEPITNDTYRIVARGNGYTSGTTIQDFVLLKAAETAKNAGQSHFGIISGNDATSHAVGQTPGTFTTNVYGNTAFSTYNPGISYNIVFPGQDTYIRVFTPKIGDQLPAGSFRADEIIANIGPRVQRPS